MTTKTPANTSTKTPAATVSLLAKIRTAASDKAKQAEAQKQAEQATPAGRMRTRQPPPPAAAPVATPTWKPTRTRGRPRQNFAKSRREWHPVSEFMEDRLIGDPDCAEYVGPCRAAGITAGTTPKYHRMTLIEAFTQFCREKGYPPVKPATLSGLILKFSDEFGWPTIHTRSLESRRCIIKGLCFKGQPGWNGDDRGFLGDRKRWKKKSDAA